MREIYNVQTGCLFLTDLGGTRARPPSTRAKGGNRTATPAAAVFTFTPRIVTDWKKVERQA